MMIKATRQTSLKKRVSFLAALLGLGLCSLAKTAWATDLVDVYQQALQSDPVYQAAIATRLSQHEALPQSIANLLPTVSGSANTANSRVIVPASQRSLYPTTTGVRTVSKGYLVTLRQPLLNASSWMQVRESTAIVKATDATFAAAAQDLIIRVAQTYFNILLAQDNLKYIQAEKTAYAHQLEQVQQRYGVGLDTQTTVQNAKAAYDSTVAQEIAAQVTLQNNQEAMRLLTNQVYPRIEGLKVTLPLLVPQPPNVEQWVNAAKQHNLALQAATYKAQAAKENIGVAFGGHLPTATAIGSYNQAYDQESGVGHSDINTRTLGVQANVPIFSGGLTSSQVRQAKDDFQTAQAKQEDALRQAISTTRQKYNDVMAGLSKIRADRAAILSAQESLTSTQESFKVGTRTIVQVLLAQQALYQAKSNYAKDEYTYLLDTLLLKQAAGTLSPHDLSAINQWFV